jgi:type I restriction enzyme S subunit
MASCPEDWQVLPLADVADFQEGPGILAKDFREVGVPLLRLKCVEGDFVTLDGCNYLDPEMVARKWNHFRVEAGDLLISTSASLGRVSVVTDQSAGGVPYTGLIRFKPKNERVVPEYLKAFLGSAAFVGQAEAMASGSVIRHFGPSHIRQMAILLPPADQQMAIGQVASLLDERLRLLRETNATLEYIAQALFKSWFIDFDPVRAKAEGREPEGMDAATAALFPAKFDESALGLIPKGWKVGEIGQAADCVGGGTPSTKERNYWEPALHHWTTPKDLSGLNAPVLLNTERRLSDLGLAKVSSGLLPAGTLLMSSRAPIGYLAIAQIPVAVNQGFIAMRPDGLLPPVYLYLWCQANMETIKQKANGSTFMEISKMAFRPIPMVLPVKEIVARFATVAGALFSRIADAERHRALLKELRDTLLPRLISGKLRIPEARKLVDAAVP